MLRRLLLTLRVRWAQAQIAECQIEERRAMRDLERLHIRRRYWMDRLLRLRARATPQRPLIVARA